MIGDLIHDTFYVNLSKRGKIKGIRQFSEVLVRKILNIGNNEQLTLGNAKCKPEFAELPENRKIYLEVAIEKIRSLGNSGTHTQHTAEFSDDELITLLSFQFSYFLHRMFYGLFHCYLLL